MIHVSEILQINKFAKLHNGKNIFFCKTDFLSSLFENLYTHQEPSILITGNSDYLITDDVISHKPKCIKKWFAQNAETENELVTGIPMGIENHEQCIIEGHGVGWPHAKKKIELLSNSHMGQPIKNIYANFSLDTHSSRKGVYDICYSQNTITTSVSSNHREINKRSYEQYIDDILDHRMVVCPRGNGVDCHRVWEVLYLDRVPIIKREMAMNYFEELPIIYLDNWLELTNMDMIVKKYNKVKNNSRKMLNFDSWKKLIQDSLIEK